MKTLKINFVLTIISLMIASCNSHAQDHHRKGHGREGHKNFSPDTMAKRQTEFMKKELSLSADQESKVQDVNLNYAKKRKEIMDEMHKQMESIDKAQEQDLQGILSKDQMTKLKEKKSEWKGKRKGKCKDNNHQKK